MSIMVGAGVVALVATGYLGRKGWLAFHRAVGITPGTLQYVEPSKRPPPQMMQLSVEQQQLSYLPAAILEQIQRIDSQATVYQQWREEAEQAGQSIAATEEEFVVRKLLDVRLPEMLNSYQRIVRHDIRVQQAIRPNYRYMPDNNNALSESHSEALKLLSELLSNIENRLADLLKRCHADSLQDMQVMHRYLNERQ